MQSGSFAVIGKGFLPGLVDSEALLGPLRRPWTHQRRMVDGYPRPRYYNTENHTQQINDPRLGPLCNDWTETERERTPDDPFHCKHFMNSVTGEVINSDPRLSPDLLQDQGVDIEWVRLE